MASKRYESMWKLISQNKFEYESDENVRCGICEGLLIDACQSHCGCQFCHSCIRGFIDREIRFCPGWKGCGNIDPLSFDKTIIRNPILNERVARLEVICPNELCGAKIQLIEMETNLRDCAKQCRVNFEPFHREPSLRTEYLIEIIQNMKNEINVLRDESDKRKVENIELKKHLLTVGAKLNGAFEEIKKNWDKSRRDIERLITTVVYLKREMRESTERNDLEIDNLKQQFEEKENRIAALEEEIRQLKQECINDAIVTKGEGQLQKNTVSIESKLNGIYSIWPSLDADYIWRLDGVSTKIGSEMYSDSFYSNHYKFRLGIHIYSGHTTSSGWMSKIRRSNDGIGLYCYVMSGDFDDTLTWPMRRDVTLSIIDQCTLAAYASQTFKYDTYEYKSRFDRPTDQTNIYGIGTFSFIKYSAIRDKASVIVDDSIIISCIIK